MREGVLTPDQLAKAQQDPGSAGQRLGYTLVKLGLVTETAILKVQIGRAHV